MSRVVEVYIMNKEVVTQTFLEGKPLAASETVHYCSVKEISKTEKIVSEQDRAVVQLVEKLAAERKFQVRIIDVASFKGKIRAKLKNVKMTPTIIVGNKRAVGVPEKEELDAILSQ